MKHSQKLNVYSAIDKTQHMLEFIFPDYHANKWEIKNKITKKNLILLEILKTHTLNKS